MIKWQEVATEILTNGKNQIISGAVSQCLVMKLLLFGWSVLLLLSKIENNQLIQT